MEKPQFGRPWHNIMFNARHVVDRECNVFFNIRMVQDYPIQIKVINELGHK